MKKKKKKGGWWIITNSSGCVLLPSGSFKNPRDIIYHDLAILRHRGPYTQAREMLTLLQRPGADTRKIKRVAFYLVFIPLPWPEKLLPKHLQNRNKSIRISTENDFIITDLETREIKKKWRIKPAQRITGKTDWF